jgi:hypothetical protein
MRIRSVRHERFSEFACQPTCNQEYAGALQERLDDEAAWLAALVDARRGAEPAAQIAMVLGIALSANTVRMRAMTAKAAKNRRSKASVSLTLAAVTAQATGTPSPSTATWYFVPRLARSVGLRSAAPQEAGEAAAALGPHRAAIQDQVRMAAQHADQQGVRLRQQARPRPARHVAAQCRAARLVRSRGQATP